MLCLPYGALPPRGCLQQCHTKAAKARGGAEMPLFEPSTDLVWTWLQDMKIGQRVTGSLSPDQKVHPPSLLVNPPFERTEGGLRATHIAARPDEIFLVHTSSWPRSSEGRDRR